MTRASLRLHGTCALWLISCLSHMLIVIRTKARESPIVSSDPPTSSSKTECRLSLQDDFLLIEDINYSLSTSAVKFLQIFFEV